MDAQQCLQLDDGHIKAAVRFAKASKVIGLSGDGFHREMGGCRESEVKVELRFIFPFGEEALYCDPKLWV